MQTLYSFGLKGIALNGPIPDPSSEEELFAIDFKTTQPISWETYMTKYNELKEIEGLKLLRLKRDQLLKDTDWIMTYDVMTTIKNLDEWKVYRQALRDLPQNTTIVWKNNLVLDFNAMNIPVKPELKR